MPVPCNSLIIITITSMYVCNRLQVFYNVGKTLSDTGQIIIAEAAYRRAIMSVFLVIVCMRFIL